VTRVAVARTKYAVGFPSDKGVPFAYQVLELHEALQRRYTSDAHLVTYVADGLARQQRVNKPGLLAYPHTLRIECFFADVDNPGHALWTDDTLAEARASDPYHEALATAGLYYTSGGRRIVQPLEKPILVGEAEPYIKAWLTSLERASLAVDHNCRDWTRHFRLPYVRREGLKHTQIPDCLDLSRMRPVVPPEPTENAELAAIPTSRNRRPRDVHVGAWTSELPDVWRSTAETLAVAVRQVQGEWHTLFMALAGALLSRGMPPEHLPALCHAVSQLTGNDDRTDDRVTCAKTTVERWRAGLPVAGHRSLAASWPDVAAAVTHVMARGEDRRRREALATLAAPAVPSPDLQAVTHALEEAIRHASDGLTLIQASCGLGKTRAAEKVAAERAAKTHANPNAKGDRAPFNSKTAISVDKHALAQQIVTHLHVLNTPARRHFGPLSLKAVDGKPVCKFADVAEHLVVGGQAMQWLLCDGQGRSPCEHASTCKAREGAEGPKDARVDVGPHALMGQLDSAAGTTGLLVLDEPPSLLDTHTFSMEDLDQASRHLHAFESDYVDALRPALEALLVWARTESDLEPTSPRQVVKHFARTVPEETLAKAQRAALLPGNADALMCAQHTPISPNGPPVPPITQPNLARVRKEPRWAAQVGGASRVLHTLRHVLDETVRSAARIEERGGRRVVHITHANESFHTALQREGSIVVLDANADIHAPVFETIAGHQVPLLRFEAPDGAEIERSLCILPHATRTAWLSQGKLKVTETLVRAVRTAIAWANETPGNGVLAIIAIRVIELALRASWAPDDAEAHKAWAEAGQDEATLALVRAKLGPVLATWKGTILFGHYGALRGLDMMAEADNLVTIGDPWNNIDQARHETAFLGLPDWNKRLDALCQAELEQAHGRLRTIHRTRKGRALHIGKMRPGGSLWSGAIKVAAPERPALDSGELLPLLKRLGSIQAVAEHLGVGRGVVARALEKPPGAWERFRR